MTRLPKLVRFLVCCNVTLLLYTRGQQRAFSSNSMTKQGKDTFQNALYTSCTYNIKT